MGMTATRIRILETKKTGEHETYKWEYKLCLERMALFQRLLDKRQVARHLSSSTKASP